jgi:glycosyltransferase involved in cell wall biosynthesis
MKRPRTKIVMKFAVLSAILPPSASGQTMVLYNLLKGFSGEDYCLISQEEYQERSPNNDFTELLPGRYCTLADETFLRRGERFGVPQRLGYAYIPLRIRSRARHIADILRREGCTALVGCTSGWDCLNLPAGYFACRELGIPFYAYMFDYYSKQWEGPMYWGEGRYVRLARRLEAMVVKGSAGVIAPNEFLRDELKDRYHIEPTVIHNPCDLSRYPMTYQKRATDTSREARIVYTGDIYDAHFDAFSNLMQAIKLTGREDVKLHAYTIRPSEYLREHGIDGPIVLHPHAANDLMPQIQADADVLFLALAFRSPYPAGNRTAAPGKTGEYLAAGRPVLVHAPRDSFVAWYFRTNQCGLVVDEDDPQLLARELTKLLADESLQQRLVANALKCAGTDFALSAVREKFVKLLQPNIAPIKVSASLQRA